MMAGETEMTERRLDQMLVERGLFPTRSRARDAIARGHVRVDGALARKAGQSVRAGAALRIDDPAAAYVSRGALKLKAALDHFAVTVPGAHALDLGASTGGFSQLLLERGAARIVALDVGHGQMDAALAADPRIMMIERFNARHLGAADLPFLPDMVVADLSFVSLRIAAAPALHLAEFGAHCVLLVKPQFELSPGEIGKGGLVRDPEAGLRAASDLSSWLDGLAGWRSLGTIASPVTGGDGNREYLLAGRKDRTL